MRILGIDPGSRITGFGVVEVIGGRVQYLASGCIRTSQGALPGRLKEIFNGVSAIAEQHAAQLLVIEQVFVHRNVATALKLGQARGAALCAAVLRDLRVHEYTPAQVKQAIVGKGNATKPQVQHMVRVLLNLPAVPQADAADALAIALCHCHTQQTLAHLHGAARPSRLPPGARLRTSAR